MSRTRYGMFTVVVHTVSLYACAFHGLALFFSQSRGHIRIYMHVSFRERYSEQDIDVPYMPHAEFFWRLFFAGILKDTWVAPVPPPASPLAGSFPYPFPRLDPL